MATTLAGEPGREARGLVEEVEEGSGLAPPRGDCWGTCSGIGTRAMGATTEAGEEDITEAGVDGEEDIIEAGGVVEARLDFRGDLPPPVEPGQLRVLVGPEEDSLDLCGGCCDINVFWCLNLLENKFQFNNYSSSLRAHVKHQCILYTMIRLRRAKHYISTYRFDLILKWNHYSLALQYGKQ